MKPTTNQLHLYVPAAEAPGLASVPEIVPVVVAETTVSVLYFYFSCLATYCLFLLSGETLYMTPGRTSTAVYVEPPPHEISCYS